jgi:hypothetical protein
MDRKISKLVDDSKWKMGAAVFVMQLKIKYFVTEIAILRFVRKLNDLKSIFLVDFSQTFSHATLLLFTISTNDSR